MLLDLGTVHLLDRVAIAPTLPSTELEDLEEESQRVRCQLGAGPAVPHRGDQALDVDRLDSIQSQIAETGGEVGPEQRPIGVQRRGLTAKGAQVGDQLLTGLLDRSALACRDRRDGGLDLPAELSLGLGTG